MSGVVTGKPETRSVLLTTNLTDKENYIVNLHATNQDECLGLAVDATKNMYPLLEGYDGSSIPKTGTIAIGGTCKVKLGGTVTVNSFLTSDNAGKAIACTADNQLHFGVALQNGVNGDIIVCKIAHGTFVIL